LASPYGWPPPLALPAQRSATTGHCWWPPALSLPARPRPPRSRPAAARSRNGCASPASSTTSSATPWPRSACRPGLASTSCSRDQPRTPRGGRDRLDALLAPVRAAGVQPRLTVHGSARPLPAAVDLAAYRILQEALTNVLRPAQARHVRGDP